MGEIRDIKNVKPVCAVTFSQNLDPDIPMKELESVMGTLDDLSERFDFSFTDYYLEEMGENLKKVFVSFKGLMHPGLLPDRKNKTQLLEMRWTEGGKRRINCDPGYLTGAKLVLASTKDFAHRIYLSDGIYGDVQLQFRQNRFHMQPWTFPDYKTDLAIAFFTRVRKKFMNEERSYEKIGI